MDKFEELYMWCCVGGVGSETQTLSFIYWVDN